MTDLPHEREALAASLPEPGPDEPASLRDDIADELADHLQMAFAHELVNTGEESTARKRVLDRFGDPGAVARRLWWDAMKGRIMRNRLTGLAVVLSLLVAVGSAGGILFVARSMQASQERMLAMQAETQARLMAEIARLHEQRAPKAVERPNRSVKVRLVTEKNGRPVVGATCGVLLVVGGQSHSILRVSNQEGMADLGELPPGPVALSVMTSNHWTCQPELIGLTDNLPPIVELVCPEPDEVSLGTPRSDIDVPSELKVDGLDQLRFVVVFGSASRQIGQTSWGRDGVLPRRENGSERSETLPALVCDARGQILELMEIWTGDELVTIHRPPLESSARQFPAGTYSVQTVIATTADDIAASQRSTPQFVSKVRMNLSKELHVAPNTESTIRFSEDEFAPLWQSVKSMAFWPRDRVATVRINGSHQWQTFALDKVGEGQLALMDASSPYVRPESRRTLANTGDVVKLSFTLKSCRELDSQWTFPSPSIDVSPEQSGLFRLELTGFETEPLRVKVKVNRFQEQWLAALQALPTSAVECILDPSDITERRRIVGFGLQKEYRPLLEILEKQPRKPGEPD